MKVSYDAQADGMAICNEDLIIISANRLFARFLGVDKRDMTGKSILELIAFEDISMRKQALKNRKLADGMHAKGIAIRTLGGTRATIDFWLRPIESDLFLLYFNRSSRQKFLFSNVYDLKDSVRKSQMEAIFRETYDHLLIYCNEAMIRMFGYTSSAHINSFFNSDAFAQDGERQRLLAMLAAHGQLEDERVLCKRADQSNFWGLFNCKIIEKNGELFFDGVIVDITEQLKREELLRERADALEKINGELDRFLYSASHDIRAPISSMRGLITLMNMESEPGTYMKMLEISLNKLDNFVSELTLFSQNKRQRVNSEEIDFPDIINRIFSKMRTHPGFESINLETEFRLDTVFFSDMFRIELVLEQIIKNSYEFHDSTKSSRFILVQVHALADKAILDIADNGTGIPKAHIGKVFDMFYRASNQTKGAGIGLYITREAITLLKGTISIFSEFGVGTSIRIELPNAMKGKLIARKKSLRGQRYSR